MVHWCWGFLIFSWQVTALSCAVSFGQRGMHQNGWIRALSRWSCSVCLRGDSGCLFETLSASREDGMWWSVLVGENFSLSDSPNICVLLRSVPQIESASMRWAPSGWGRSIRGRCATPLPGCPRWESSCCWTPTEIELCRWFGGSSLLKNLHCLTHFRNSEDHERCIGAGLGSTVAVVDVDSGFAEPRCSAR